MDAALFLRYFIRLADNFVNYSFFASDIFTSARDFPGKEKETPGRRAVIYRRIICVYMCPALFPS